jgi:ribosomal protein L37E
MAELTYVIGRTGCDAWIYCRRCGRRSFNRNDIAARYCGYCHEFHVTPIDEAAERQARVDSLAPREPAS